MSDFMSALAQFRRDFADIIDRNNNGIDDRMEGGLSDAGPVPTETAEPSRMQMPSFQPSPETRHGIGDVETGMMQTTFEEDERTRNVLRGVGGAAAEMTGVPSMMRGAETFGRGYDGGDIFDMLSGAGQVALGAIPGASLTRAGGQMLSAAAQYPGRAAATVGGIAAAQAPAGVRDAQASSDAKIAKAIQSDPRVAALQRQIAEIEEKRIKSMSSDIKGQNKTSADASRAKIDKALADRLDGSTGPDGKPIAGLRQQLADIENAIRTEYLDNAPFRERHPGKAEMIQAGAAGLATFLPFANTVKGKLADSLIHAPSIRRSAQAADDALYGVPASTNAFGRATPATPPDMTAHGRHITDLKAKTDNWARNNSQADPIYSGDYAKSVPANALMMFEASSIPEQADVMAFAPGHPTRENAKAEFVNGDYYTSRILPSLLGGMATSAVGRKVGDLVTPGSNPMPAANAAMSRPVPHNPQGGGPPPIQPGRAPYTPKHSAESQAALSNDLDGFAYRYANASPTERQQIMQQARQFLDTLDTQRLRRPYQSGGLGQPSDKNVRSRASGTASSMEDVHARGGNPFDSSGRAQSFGGSFGGKKQLAVTGATATAGATASHEQEEPSHHSQVQPRTKGGQFDGPPNWD